MNPFDGGWLIVVTLLFALVHVGPERVYLWWTGSACVFGLGLGVLYDVQGGLLAPIVMLVISGSDWKMTGSGMSWSLIAGIVGAIGAEHAGRMVAELGRLLGGWQKITRQQPA